LASIVPLALGRVGGKLRALEGDEDSPSSMRLRPGATSARKALDYCKRNKGTKLVVATLSRLTRDTKFLLTLIDGSVDVVFTDLPQVPPGAMGRFFLTMMAAVAEYPRGYRSNRGPKVNLILLGFLLEKKILKKPPSIY
jgi:hypothetical protein